MPDWLVPILTVVLGVLAPTLTVMTLLHRARTEVLNDIRNDVRHIDECVDKLKIEVVGYASRSMTRGELDATLLRMREGISGDTRGLHDRLMLVEGLLFHREVGS